MQGPIDGGLYSEALDAKDMIGPETAPDSRDLPSCLSGLKSAVIPFLVRFPSCAQMRAADDFLMQFATDDPCSHHVLT